MRKPLEYMDWVVDLEDRLITTPRNNGQPVDRDDEWRVLQAMMAAETLIMLETISDQLTDLSADIEDPPNLQADMLKKLAANVEQIKLNTAPD